MRIHYRKSYLFQYRSYFFENDPYNKKASENYKETSVSLDLHFL